MVKFQSHDRGYIALISTIVITFLLIAVTITLGFNGFLGRFNILDSESKERSLALAEACVDVAILKLSKDPAYVPNPVFNFVTQTGGESITVTGSDQCTIVSITEDSSGNTFIKTKAVVNNSHSNLRITIDVGNNFVVTGWQECPNLTASTSDC